MATCILQCAVCITSMQIKDLVDPRIDMMSSAKKRKQLPFSPLHVATVLGHLEQVKRMVEEGANPLDTDINNDTLLHFAAHWGSIDILKYLIEDVDCNPATEGWNGTTVLHAAAGKGQLLVMKYLVEDYNMEVSTPDLYGHYPLHHACVYGHIKAVQYLINRMQQYKELVLPMISRTDRYTTENSESSECLTEALCQACFSGHLPTVKYLIENIGIESYAKNKSGRQPIHFAAFSWSAGSNKIFDRREIM